MRINKNGLTGTIVIHGLVLALLILGGLTFPDPPPEEEGVLVNFGTDDSGFGSVEPQGDEANQGTPAPPVTENLPQETYTPPEPAVTESAPADNTQDVEEVVVKEDPQPTAEEIARQQAEQKRIREAQEAERIRKAEEERIRKEQEAERKRIEEEQRRQEEQANRINNLGRNAMGRQGVGEQDGSEGVNPGGGTNQGTNTGSPGASNYGDGSGLGNSYGGLGSRKVVGKLSIPNVNDCNVTSRIVIRVAIQVSKSGEVTKAEIQKSTFSDLCINRQVLNAAKNTKFTADSDASFIQTGWIEYTIEP